MLNCWGIYTISCQCGLSYIGQTKCRLCVCLNEHKLDIHNQEINKSPIAEHCRENDHTFNFHSAKIICKPTSVFELDFLDAYYIHKNHNNVDCDFAISPLSDCWKSFIRSNFS